MSSPHPSVALSEHGVLQKTSTKRKTLFIKVYHVSSHHNCNLVVYQQLVYPLLLQASSLHAQLVNHGQVTARSLTIELNDRTS